MGLAVIQPGLATTVQDLGRTEYRAWGVPVGGAFDRGSAALANALLGNAPCCAVLEMTLVGGVFEARVPLAVALAGAPMEAALLGRDGRERPLTLPLSVPLGCGERLVLGGSARGARTYLAVRGGWHTPVVLGSRSAETRLKAGDLLPADPGSTPVRHLAEDLAIVPSPSGEPIRLIDGPDASDACGPHAWESRAFRVGRQSDRMGLRLEGEAISGSFESGRTSMPVAPGAVQVAGGRLILLGVACGTMGGYPHVAHVITADLDRIGQARPGDILRFRRIGLDEARQIDRIARLRQAEWYRRVATIAADDPVSPPPRD